MKIQEKCNVYVLLCKGSIEIPGVVKIEHGEEDSRYFKFRQTGIVYRGEWVVCVFINDRMASHTAGDKIIIPTGPITRAPSCRASPMDLADSFYPLATITSAQSSTEEPTVTVNSKQKQVTTKGSSKTTSGMGLAMSKHKTRTLLVVMSSGRREWGCCSLIIIRICMRGSLRMMCFMGRGSC